MVGTQVSWSLLGIHTAIAKSQNRNRNCYTVFSLGHLNFSLAEIPEVWEAYLLQISTNEMKFLNCLNWYRLIWQSTIFSLHNLTFYILFGD